MNSVMSSSEFVVSRTPLADSSISSQSTAQNSSDSPFFIGPPIDWDGINVSDRISELNQCDVKTRILQPIGMENSAPDNMAPACNFDPSPFGDIRSHMGGCQDPSGSNQGPLSIGKVEVNDVSTVISPQFQIERIRPVMADDNRTQRQREQREKQESEEKSWYGSTDFHPCSLKPKNKVRHCLYRPYPQIASYGIKRPHYFLINLTAASIFLSNPSGYQCPVFGVTTNSKGRPADFMMSRMPS